MAKAVWLEARVAGSGICPDVCKCLIELLAYHSSLITVQLDLRMLQLFLSLPFVLLVDVQEPSF